MRCLEASGLVGSVLDWPCRRRWLAAMKLVLVVCGTQKAFAVICFGVVETG